MQCTVQTYWLDRVLQGLGKFLRLISHGLSNNVYNLKFILKFSVYVTKFILNNFMHNIVYNKKNVYRNMTIGGQLTS